MEQAPNIPPYLSVSEALAIFKRKNFVMLHTIHVIREKCNIPKSNATCAMLWRKMLAAIQQRKHARKCSRLATWVSDAEHRIFCNYLPVTAATADAPATWAIADTAATPPVNEDYVIK